MQITSALPEWRPLQTDFGNVNRIQEYRFKNSQRTETVTTGRLR